MFTKEAIELLSQAQAITAANESASGTFVALPDGFSITDLEVYNSHRRRMRGTMTTSNIANFAAYFQAHEEDDGSAVFVDPERLVARAVLNMGNPDAPGHCDHTAIFQPRPTAGYLALRNTVGQQLKQAAAAEFLEDWAKVVECYAEGASEPTPFGLAVAAVRQITIDAARKVESNEQSLSASRSTFESVKASSTNPLPALIKFTTAPFLGFKDREFLLRVSVLTSNDKPLLVLRAVNLAEHLEEMAEELSAMVAGALEDHQVVIGTFTA